MAILLNLVKCHCGGGEVATGQLTHNSSLDNSTMTLQYTVNRLTVGGYWLLGLILHQTEVVAPV